MEACNVIFYFKHLHSIVVVVFSSYLVEKCVSFVMKQIVQYMLEVLSNHLFRMITAIFWTIHTCEAGLPCHARYFMK